MTRDDLRTKYNKTLHETDKYDGAYDYQAEKYVEWLEDKILKIEKLEKEELEELEESKEEEEILYQKKFPNNCGGFGSDGQWYEC